MQNGTHYRKCVAVCRQLAESSNVYAVHMYTAALYTNFAIKNCLFSFCHSIFYCYYYLKMDIYKHTFACVLWCRSVLFIAVAAVAAAAAATTVAFLVTIDKHQFRLILLFGTFFSETKTDSIFHQFIAIMCVRACMCAIGEWVLLG